MAKTALVVKKRKNGELQQVPKVDLFLKEFLANGGNATEAATKAFGLTNRSSAAVIGARYLKEARGAARIYLEHKGATYGKLLDIALEKAEKSKNTEWWDRLMKLAGYEDFMSKGKADVSVNIMTAQNAKNDFTGFIEEGEVVEIKPEPEPDISDGMKELLGYDPTDESEEDNN